MKTALANAAKKTLGTVQMSSPIRMECFVPSYDGDMSGFVAIEGWLRDVHAQTQALEEACID